MSNNTSRHSSYQVMIGRVLVVCFALAITPSTSRAQLFYDFIEGDTGDVLATLELTRLPATFQDVAGLTFPAEGELFNRFGPTYLGAFNAFTGDDVAETLPNNLGCPTCSGGFAEFIELSPLGSPDGHFGLGFSNTFGRDRIRLFVAGFLEHEGDWLKVPEPSTGSYLISAVLISVGSARRRKRQA